MKIIREMILCIIGSVIACMGINVFLVPAGLYSGGFVGIAQILSYVISGGTRLSGILYFAVNVPLFLIGLKVLGKSFIWKSVLVITLETVLLSVIPVPTELIISNQAVSGIIAGCIMGIGAGITFLGFGSGGGTDIIGFIISKKQKTVSVGTVAIAVNMIVYIICGILFGIETAIYSFIASVFSSLLIDKIHKQNKILSVNILTGHPEKIKDLILKDINRGATILSGTGMYSGREMYMVVCIMSEYELQFLKNHIYQADPHVFLFAQNVSGLYGNYQKRLEKDLIKNK